MLQLKVTAGPDKGKVLALEPGKTYTIGGDADSSLSLSDPLVLKGHCSLEVGARGAVLRNHTASAGTYVEDEKVSQAQIGPNSSFRIGDTTLTLVRLATTSAGAADPLIGKILGGYKLKAIVGEGGMGKVFLATQLSLHRDVAVKVLRDQLAKDNSFRDLFINEARAAAQLVHPNIVQVFDGKTEGSLTFFSMEFIGQGSVEEILARDGKIAWEEAILMVLEAAHGLEYAEGKGIVHRDIKPDNLMINDDGRVKIADLGLAKRGEGSQQKGIIGTPHFIPPEQALGKEVDHRADLYSLGATFFRMITGKNVFSGKTAKEIVIKHIKEPPPAASSSEPSVPDDLDLVISKMLAKEPDARYQSATDLIRALEEVCAHHGIKGSIIKKGVGKRVLIPVVLLLLAAVGAAIHFGTQDPVEVESEATKQARIAAEARAKEQQEQRAKAEKNTRRSQAAERWGGLENKQLRLSLDNNAIESVYDDEDKKVTAERELKWVDLAQQLDEFAEHDLAKEFESESQYSTNARRRAKKIRDDLRKLKESAVDKREKIALMVKKAGDIDKKQQEILGDLRLKLHYEKAANLCTLVDTGHPKDKDPFKDVVSWVWVSPVDKDVRQPAVKIPTIMKIVDESRKYFRKERPKLLKLAVKVAKQALADADGLGESASDAERTTVIEALERLAESFVDEAAETKIPEVRNLVRDVAKKRDELEKALERRQTKRLEADRLLVRNKQRKLASLDKEQLPNLVMKCEFEAAINAWNQLLENKEIQTERYDRFVRERIQMARWCEYLFGRFRKDFNNGELTTKSLGDIELKDRVARRASIKAIPTRYTLTLNKRFGQNTTLRLANVPMDWVYHRYFLFENELRWKEPPVVVHFALGAFCFETMQYKQAMRHFDEVLKINGEEAERYTEIAKSLRARAQKEEAARAEWEALCAGVRNAKTSQELAAVKTRILAYGNAHEGTLFQLEVMGTNDVVDRDFYDPEWPAPPKAPPSPDE